MLEMAENVWFPHTYKAIQSLAKHCAACQRTGKNLPCTPCVHLSAPRPAVTHCFDELELEFLGPLFFNPPSQQYVLVAVDRHSRFPFAACCAALTAEVVTRFLSELHLLFGLPRALRSDQGTRFTSTHLQHWCANNGVQLIYSPVGDHRGTGLVERLFRTLLALELLAHPVACCMSACFSTLRPLPGFSCPCCPAQSASPSSSCGCTSPHPSDASKASLPPGYLLCGSYSSCTKFFPSSPEHPSSPCGSCPSRHPFCRHSTFSPWLRRCCPVAKPDALPPMTHPLSRLGSLACQLCLLGCHPIAHWMLLPQA